MSEYATLEFIDEPTYIHDSKILRVGTDCSGIEAPIQALQQLGIPHRHVWSSEIDKYCIQSIKANYHPERIYGDPTGPYPDGDIRNRDNTRLPDIDLYVCGFPCQPFSYAGKRKGLEDKRGNVFWSCLDVIKTKKPKYFILENVHGLLTINKDNPKDKYGNTWKIIWENLTNLSEYNVKWKLMNTKDYSIPQNRERIYIIGTKTNFFWPKKLSLDNLLNYVDYNDKKYYNTNRNLEYLNKVFVDLNFRQAKFNEKFSPCLNTHGGLWCVILHRYANIKERLKLQGFNTEFKQVVSNNQMRKQIGNSMSVNVLIAILNNLLE